MSDFGLVKIGIQAIAIAAEVNVWIGGREPQVVTITPGLKCIGYGPIGLFEFKEGADEIALRAQAAQRRALIADLAISKPDSRITFTRIE